MEIKNYKDYPVFIGFLGTNNGQRVRSSVLMDSGSICSAEKVSPLPFYKGDWFTDYGNHNPIEHLSLVSDNASTILTVTFKCDGDMGAKIKSFDIGLHIAYSPCSNKGKNRGHNKRDCRIIVTKTSVAVKNIPIKKSQ